MVTHNRGFTYPLILLTVALLAIGASATNRVVSTIVKRETEVELIQRGYYFHQAIRSYYNASAIKGYPRSLDDLIRDPRFPYKAHIRKIYAEPFAESGVEPEKQWNIVRNDQGEIVGVSSKSLKKPIKTDSFPRFLTVLGSGATYSEWQFVYVPESPSRDPLREQRFN